MTAKQESEFKDLFEKQLKQQFTNGLLSGSKAMCTVILDKVNNDSFTADERLEEIRKFCITGLGENKK